MNNPTEKTLDQTRKILDRQEFATMFGAISVKRELLRPVATKPQTMADAGRLQEWEE